MEGSGGSPAAHETLGPCMTSPQYHLSACCGVCKEVHGGACLLRPANLPPLNTTQRTSHMCTHGQVPLLAAHAATAATASHRRCPEASFRCPALYPLPGYLVLHALVQRPPPCPCRRVCPAAAGLWRPACLRCLPRPSPSRWLPRPSPWLSRGCPVRHACLPAARLSRSRCHLGPRGQGVRQLGGLWGVRQMRGNPESQWFKLGQRRCQGGKAV